MDALNLQTLYLRQKNHTCLVLLFFIFLSYVYMFLSLARHLGNLLVEFRILHFLLFFSQDSSTYFLMDMIILTFVCGSWRNGLSGRTPLKSWIQTPVLPKKKTFVLGMFRLEILVFLSQL
jgi:hypothetical protein